MSTNKKSGWTEEERLRFLRDSGFVEIRQGKGSHTMWEHPELKELAKTHKLDSPDKNPWALPMCDNPASGTWHSVQKQVAWCIKAVHDIKEEEKKKDHHHDLKVAWRLARREISTWKKAQKSWLKANLPLADVPQAPESYHRYSEIREAMQPVFTKPRDPFRR